MMTSPVGFPSSETPVRSSPSNFTESPNGSSDSNLRIPISRSSSQLSKLPVSIFCVKTLAVQSPLKEAKVILIDLFAIATGRMRSLITIVVVSSEVLSQRSVTAYVTVCVPTGKFRSKFPLSELASILSPSISTKAIQTKSLVAVQLS